MHKHLSTFLYVAIGSFSFVAIAMDNPKAEPISQRVFPNPLPEELTQEEQETKNQLFGLIKEKLAAQYAAVKGISIVKPVDPEQSTASEEQEPKAQILYTNNIKPSSIFHDLKNTPKECMDYLRQQIESASAESQNKNAMVQAVKQEKARLRQIALASRKRVTAPTIVKDLVESTFQASQAAQGASASVAASTLITMPTLSVSVDSITRAVVCYPEPTPQELTHSTPAAPTYENLDDLLASLEDAIPVNRNLKKADAEIDQLLSQLSSCNPQSANPLYEDPSDANLGPIQQVERVSLKNPAVDITSKIQELHKLFSRVAKTAEQFGNETPNIPDEFSYDLQDLDKISDELAPVLRMKSENEHIPALNRLKDLAASVSETDLTLDNPALKRMIAYKSYTASLKSLNKTLALAK
jgi:hypothetical protein